MPQPGKVNDGWREIGGGMRRRMQEDGAAHVRRDLPDGRRVACEISRYSLQRAAEDYARRRSLARALSEHEMDHLVAQMAGLEIDRIIGEANHG